MLKKSIIKKISIITATILAILIINIFPNNQKTFNDINKSDKGIIYLLDDNNFVSKVDITFKSKNTYDLIYEIINIMTKDTNDSLKIRNGFNPPIPKDTKLIDCNIKDDTVTLNFNDSFNKVESNISEKMLEAIIYSITSLNNINKVNILINNKDIKYIPNTNIEINNPITKEIKINKVFNINSIDNVLETTIFYPAKVNNYNYIVPVTYYTNEKREKIEIIIDELKSSSTHNTNLISYINNKTELTSFEIKNSSLILNFNEFLLNANDIEKEVTYSLVKSIQSSYDINEVIIKVDNNILYNYIL